VQRLKQRTKAGAIGIRASLPETADFHDDEARIERMQCGIVETGGFHCPRPKTFNKNMRRRDQPPQQALTIVSAQVEPDTPLVARIYLPPQWNPGLPPVPQRITRLRFQLDDIRAEVGELSGQHVSGHQAGQV
jgi:hypothetical protein